MYEQLDPELEQMLMEGVKNHKTYSSEIGKTIKYRAISKLEKKLSLKKMLDHILEDDKGNKKILDVMFSEEGTGEEKIEKMIELNMNPLAYFNAMFVEKCWIVYHGIKDFYASLRKFSEQEAVDKIVSKFEEEDIDKLSELILEISGATEENKQKINKFPDRYVQK
jgi:hypothetical protein